MQLCLHSFTNRQQNKYIVFPVLPESFLLLGKWWMVNLLITDWLLINLLTTDWFLVNLKNDRNQASPWRWMEKMIGRCHGTRDEERSLMIWLGDADSMLSLPGQVDKETGETQSCEGRAQWLEHVTSDQEACRFKSPRVLYDALDKTVCHKKLSCYVSMQADHGCTASPAGE